MTQIIAGAHNRLFEFGHQKRNIDRVEAHEEFNAVTFNNDIAMITVSEPFDFKDPYVQPIDMLMNDADILPNTICNRLGVQSFTYTMANLCQAKPPIIY